jgi:hypothetical protein
MEPFGTTLFCDDIRFESFNKTSLIGLYGYEMLLFGNFPAQLPKLGMFCCLRFHKSQKVSGIKIQIYFPGDVEESPSHTQEVGFQFEADNFPLPDPAEYPDPSEYYGFNHPFLFSPVIIKQPGYVRIRATAGSNRIKAGSLKIRAALPAEIAQMNVSTAPAS